MYAIISVTISVTIGDIISVTISVTIGDINISVVLLLCWCVYCVSVILLVFAIVTDIAST